MAGQREKPEGVALKLRQVDVLQEQGRSVLKAAKHIGMTVQTYYRWRKERAFSAIGPRTMARAACTAIR
jgi:transposase